MVETPEASKFTSAYDRIQALVAETREIAAADSARCSESAVATPIVAPSQPAEASPDRSQWLCEMTLKEGPNLPLKDARTYLPRVEKLDTLEAGRKIDPAGIVVQPRASDRGFLPISVQKYLRLLDWTGRELRRGKRGAIPRELASIFERLCIRDDHWLETVRHYGRWFKRAAGTGVSLSEAAVRSGKRWFQGQRQAKVAFTVTVR